MINKAAAKYTPTATGERTCSGCSMFHPKDLICDLVRGIISPSGWCQHWTKQESTT